MNSFKTWLKKQLTQDQLYRLSMAYHHFFGDFSQKTWAQHGEDVLIEAYFKDRLQNGFYIDIGAHHPLRYSNTYRLYRRGWRGITIDPLPGLGSLFRKFRPRDIFVNAGVGDRCGELTFFEFYDKAVSTFQHEQAELVMKSGRKLKCEHTSLVKPIADIIDEAGAPDKIHLVSIDAEGMDEMILATWPFERWVPQMFVIEIWNDNYDVPNALKARGYHYYSRAGSSVFYVRD